mmetsp:Transcript_1201/g.2049  ORF Transcript_1201/g.2049 Transcript_1201/m.2049 type:complete len:168 (+) Transcript_1201:377-880(+)|eukprot:CAMPEP_0197528966 /NCGR_PEP_ID=MMETSP1318-20131121/26921_1 /TAXON_ID=552666 /ORGANISM="Partenskyella glossopodia, Strain RCC365" /LENGTH=167 /DNA_ID=CAMNT_0043084271 /DNA_START=364 /DNA_END=867 /DNA_ORIENTATION=-
MPNWNRAKKFRIDREENSTSDTDMVQVAESKSRFGKAATKVKTQGYVAQAFGKNSAQREVQGKVADHGIIKRSSHGNKIVVRFKTGSHKTLGLGLKGTRVNVIRGNSQAEQFGIRKGWVITHVQDKAVSDVDNVQKLIDNAWRKFYTIDVEFDTAVASKGGGCCVLS